MIKEKKTMEKYDDEKTKEQKTIKYGSERQEIWKNVDLSVLKLSFGIFEFSPLISSEEVFYLGKCENVSSDLFSNLKCCLL